MPLNILNYFQGKVLLTLQVALKGKEKKKKEISANFFLLHMLFTRRSG
jgi:hypothetical protein